MLIAICEVVLGVLILSLPHLGLRSVAVLAGIAFVLRGAVALYLGRRLHKVGAAASGLAPAA